MARLKYEDLLDRVGRFEIIRSGWLSFPRGVMAVMGKMIINRAEMQLDTCSIHYTAHSPLFRKLKPGEIIPWYHVTAETDRGGRWIVRAVEVSGGGEPEWRGDGV